MKFFLRYWLPVLIYLLVVWGISLFGNIPLAAKVVKYDKIIHFAEFFFLALLTARAMQATMRIRWWSSFWSLLLVFCAATLDEVLQKLNPQRSSDLKDLAADITGALLGVLFYIALSIFFGKGCKSVQEPISSNTSSRR